MTPTITPPSSHWPRLKLRGKFILVISVILILIFGLMAFFLLRSTHNNLTNDLNNETRVFASLATNPIGDTYGLYNQSGTLLIQQQMQKFAQLNSNVTNIAVVNLEGLSQFSLTGSPINVSTQDVASFNSTVSSNSRGEIVLDVQPYISDSGQHSYSIAYQISPTQVEHAIGRQELIISLLTLLGLLLSAAGAYEFINYFFLIPINKLNHMAGVVAAGNYESSVSSNRRDEIGTLTRSITSMAGVLESDITRLKELDKQKNEFIMIASHNLRTPLTIIEGNVSMLEEAKMDDQLKHMVLAVEESARDLKMFSEEMLTIASLESNGQAQPVFEQITIGDLLDPLISEFNDVAKKRGMVFKPSLHNPETKFYANRHQLASAIRNILDNAFKFSDKNETVELIAGVDDGKVVINVEDHGIGIKEEEIPKLFTKFHRGNDMLVYNYKGTGIGLYAAKLIVQWHNGQIHVNSRLGEGSTFTVEIPLDARQPKI